MPSSPLTERPPLGRPLPWYQSVIAALDFETTGADPHKDRPVQIAFTLSDVHGMFALRGSWQCIVNPGIPVEPGAVDVHGITQERIDDEGVQEGWALTELLVRLNAVYRLDIPLVIFNAPFDWTMLHRRVEDLMTPELKSCVQFPLGIPPLTILDPLVIDKHYVKYRKSGMRRLEPLCSEAGVWINSAHDAWFDCVGAVQLLRDQVTRQFKELASWELENIAKALPGWHYDWAYDYNKWRSSQGMDLIVADWPLLPKLKANSDGQD